MVGAHKFNWNDAEKVRELLNQGISQSQIARDYISENGCKVSRELITQIANGKRWNMDTHSFVMKEKLKEEIKNINLIENNFYLIQSLEDWQKPFFNNQDYYFIEINAQVAIAFSEHNSQFSFNSTGGLDIFIIIG